MPKRQQFIYWCQKLETVFIPFSPFTVVILVFEANGSMHLDCVLAKEHKAGGFNVLTALADSNGGKDSGADYKPHLKSYRSCLQFSLLTLYCLFPCNTVTSNSISGYSFSQSYSNKLWFNRNFNARV